MEFDKKIHALFVDIKKTFDSIYRKSLINILKDIDFSQKLINFVLIRMIETLVEIKVKSIKSDLVIVKSGSRRGNSVSLFLFNLVLEKTIREIRIESHDGIKLRNPANFLLANANDVVFDGRISRWDKTALQKTQ